MLKRMWTAVVLLSAVSLGGCGFDLGLFGDDEQEWRGLSSTVDQRASAVARSERDWLQLWTLVGQPPPRTLDEGSETAIAIFLGTRRTGGYRPQIVRISDEGEDTVVEWRELKPARGAAVVQVITKPWLIRAIPTTDGAVRFREIREAQL